MLYQNTIIFIWVEVETLLKVIQTQSKLNLKHKIRSLSIDNIQMIDHSLVQQRAQIETVKTWLKSDPELIMTETEAQNLITLIVRL